MVPYKSRVDRMLGPHAFLEMYMICALLSINTLFCSITCNPSITRSVAGGSSKGSPDFVRSIGGNAKLLRRSANVWVRREKNRLSESN